VLEQFDQNIVAAGQSNGEMKTQVERAESRGAADCGISLLMAAACILAGLCMPDSSE
jgi:hypothetical protein